MSADTPPLSESNAAVRGEPEHLEALVHAYHEAATQDPDGEATREALHNAISVATKLTGEGDSPAARQMNRDLIRVKLQLESEARVRRAEAAVARAHVVPPMALLHVKQEPDTDMQTDARPDPT